MKRFIPPFRAARRKNASFSLVEIVVALAVTTVGIVAMLSLLPVGVNTALESRRETRTAYLAEQIVSDLRSSSFTNAAILTNNGSGALGVATNFNLGLASTNYLACDGAENVLSTATAAQYANGFSGASADYLVQITVVPTTLTNLSSVYLSSVSVEVSVPAQAVLSARSRYGFQTMIGNRQ